VELFETRARGDHERAKKMIKELSTGFVAVSDAPFYPFAVELAELYPDAKVVLVRRDPDKWWASAKHVMRHITNPLLPIMAWPAPGFRWYPRFFFTWWEQQKQWCAENGVEVGPGAFVCVRQSFQCSDK
jgi:hypothetical protein